MNKALLVFIFVLTLSLVGCNDCDEANITTKEQFTQEEILQSYDYALVEVVLRQQGITTDYDYLVQGNGYQTVINTDQLFSVGELILIIEIDENKSVFIDLS